MRQRIAAASVALLLAGVLAGCGSDKPAVCSSADALRTSVDHVKDVDVTTEGGVDDLVTGLTTVESDLATVKTDAASQFSSQIDAVDSTLATLKTSASSAKGDPSATTLAAVGVALSGFTNAVQTLTNQVQSTC